jgi:ribonuclease HII
MLISHQYGHKIKPDFILMDAMPMEITDEHMSIIKGDQKSVSIAAASIIAKTTRDAYMLEMDKLFHHMVLKHTWDMAPKNI